jgi:hypothetical protein
LFFLGLFEAVADCFFLGFIFQRDFAQQSLKLPDPSFQIGFPGQFRVQLAVGVLLFPGLKLAGGNVVAPAPLSRAGSLTE